LTGTLLDLHLSWKAVGLVAQVSDDDDCFRDIQTFANITGDEDYITVYQALESPVQRTDMWRYTKLWLEGGVYSDIDTEARPALAEFLHEHKDSIAMALFEEKAATILNRFKRRLGLSSFVRFPQYHQSFMIVSRGHPALLTTLCYIKNNYLQGKYLKDKEPKRTLDFTGPGPWTDAVTYWRKHNSTLIIPASKKGNYIDHRATHIWHDSNQAYKEYVPVVGYPCLVAFQGAIILNIAHIYRSVILWRFGCALTGILTVALVTIFAS